LEFNLIDEVMLSKQALDVKGVLIVLNCLWMAVLSYLLGGLFELML